MAGLDVSVATALRLELARHLADYDGITLLVTHDAIDALTIASRVLVIDDGKVAQYGTPLEVSQQPATDHVARLVGPQRAARRRPLPRLQPHRGHRRPDRAGRVRAQPLAGRVVGVSPHGAALRLVVHATDGQELIADVTPGRRHRARAGPGP